MGAERRTNQPLTPPFLNALPLAFTQALQMLLVADAVLTNSLVAEALVAPDNVGIFQMLFRHAGATEYAEDDDDDWLHAAFDAVDTDRSGFIDHEEFEYTFAAQVIIEKVREIKNEINEMHAIGTTRVLTCEQHMQSLQLVLGLVRLHRVL